MKIDQESRAWPGWLALCLCAYGLVGGLISFLAWFLDMPRLADWDGDGISIQPNAAIAVMTTAVAGVMLWLGHNRFALVLGVLTAAIGAAGLFQIVTEIDLGINTLLMFDREWGRAGVVSPGRMGTPGATSWTLLGSAVCLLSLSRLWGSRTRRPQFAAAVLAIVALAISSLSIAGYVYQAEILFTLPRLTVIALQTATFIFALSLAMIFLIENAGPMRVLNERGSTAALLRQIVPAIVIIPLFLGWVQLIGERFGLYDRAFGIAAATIIEIVLLLGLLLWTGRAGVDTEARKTAMFETALDCIISIDHRGSVTEFNPAAEKTFGYRRENVIGRELAELIIPHEMREAHRRGLARYLATGEGPVVDTRIELTALRANGSEFPVELSITRIRTGGLPQFTAYLRDITDRKAAEQAMQHARDVLEQRVTERTAELYSTNQALLRSNEELEQFASVASHDLQEPLRKIQAFGDRLETRFGDILGDQGRTYVERMNYSATRMRSLIDSLLTFARVTTKAEPFVATDLARIAADVVSDLEARIIAYRGRVEIGELPTIEADPLQMTQLFLNLIGNGLKFNRPDEPPVVAVSGKSNGSVCELSFTDNGVGFEEKYLDRIFEVFQRLHGRQEYEGTGMGLAICRKIAERHGGSITAVSSLGKGSTFLVTLPVARTRE